MPRILSHEEESEKQVLLSHGQSRSVLMPAFSPHLMYRSVSWGEVIIVSTIELRCQLECKLFGQLKLARMERG